MAKAWTPSSWQGFPAEQQPDWPDQGDLDRALKQIASYPPLVFAGEARSLQTSDLKGAIQRYDEVLQVEPDNPEALTYRGWLVTLVGSQANAADLVQKGEASLQRAMQVAPSYADPFCFEAIVRFRMFNDATGASAPVQQCLALNPPQEVLGLVQGLKDEIDAAVASSTTAP